MRKLTPTHSYTHSHTRTQSHTQSHKHSCALTGHLPNGQREESECHWSHRRLHLHAPLTCDSRCEAASRMCKCFVTSRHVYSRHTLYQCDQVPMRVWGLVTDDARLETTAVPPASHTLERETSAVPSGTQKLEPSASHWQCVTDEAKLPCRPERGTESSYGLNRPRNLFYS